jgi:hypothetical protein
MVISAGQLPFIDAQTDGQGTQPARKKIVGRLQSSRGDPCRDTLPRLLRNLELHGSLLFCCKAPGFPTAYGCRPTAYTDQK